MRADLSSPRQGAGRLVELLLLGGAVLTPLAPPVWAALALLLILAAWLCTRPPRREILAGGGALSLAAVALLAGAFLTREDGPRTPVAAYARAWSEIDSAAARAALAFPDPAAAAAAPLAAFDELASLAGERGPTLLLINPDGDAVVWSGPGLLHDPRPGTLPAAGPWAEASFSAVTLFAVEPLETARRPWRIVAARSFATDGAPFAGAALAGIGFTGRRGLPWRTPAKGLGVGEGLHWSVVREESGDGAADEARAFPGAATYALSGKPSLVVDLPGPPAAGFAARASGRGPAAGAPLAWGLIGLALLALALMRTVGLALPVSEPKAAGRSEVVLLATAGLAAWALAAGTGAGALWTWVGGGAVAAAGLAVERRIALGRAQVAGGWRPALAGSTAAAAAALVAWALQRRFGPLALGAELLGDAPALAVHLGFAAGTFGLLVGAAALLVGRSGSLRPTTATGAIDPNVDPSSDSRLLPGERWAWLAVVALVAAGASHDVVWLALPLLAAGAAATVRWLSRRPLRLGAAAGSVLALCSCLLAAGAWETAQRALTRRDLGARVAAALAPPSATQLAAWEAAARTDFAAADLETVTPRTPQDLGRQDLALTLWKASPLARPNAASALRVEPLEGPPSTFSFGLPIDEDGFPLLPPAAIEEASGWPVMAVGRPLISAGEAPVTSGGEPWGRLRWWLIPRPGFLLPSDERLTEIEVGLLRGGGGGGLGGSGVRVAGLPAGALAALYDSRGQALVSPWPETPPMPAALRSVTGSAASSGDGLRRARVPTPDGLAWGFSRPVGGLWSVVYLPRLGPLAGLERVAIHAVGSLLALFLSALAALLLAIPRREFRELARRAVRSYSKRLLVVYTLLLLMPLLLLNFLLVAAAEERLERQQRAAGEAALASVQRQVADLLEALPPGFGLDTSLDDELLSRISRTVHHEVNLYWRSSIYASSKAELFAAGLLPRRIPGDVHARLAFLGYELASRVNRVGGASYLELYSPVRLPGAPPALPPATASAGGLVLSVPLLAQQDEVARELGDLRRQAFVVTVGLFALLTAVGVRLARNFTRPLMEVVRGTRRIAGGATSLDLSPRDIELAALVEAVDEMAARIAEGRRKLLREKEVVDRIVESITSGVVSLDRQGRVLMTNRVAAELLGVAEGRRLEELLAADERFAPVAAFVAERNRTGSEKGAAAESAVLDTVRLADAEGEEREWSLVWVPVPGGGEPSALLVVEDATETLRGQRLQAWAEMARIIAHEIKNPLTPLQLNVEHLRQVWRDRGTAGEAGASGGEADDGRFSEILDRCTAAALVQVEELRQIATEFSTYSSIPRIDLQPGDLATALGELVGAYRAAPPPGVTIGFAAEPAAIPARFDRKLLGRAVRNLMENAVRASGGSGAIEVRVERQEVSAREVPTVGRGTAVVGRRAPAAQQVARISVGDSGPGVAPELLPRIFDPYFSTHDTGTGLGLPIARQVAEEHGGGIAARNRPGGGLEVTITIPLG